VPTGVIRPRRERNRQFGTRDVAKLVDAQHSKGRRAYEPALFLGLGTVLMRSSIAAGASIPENRTFIGPHSQEAAACRKASDFSRENRLCQEV